MLLFGGGGGGGWWVVGGGRHGRMRGGRLVDSCVKFQILEDE